MLVRVKCEMQKPRAEYEVNRGARYNGQGLARTTSNRVANTCRSNTYRNGGQIGS